MSFQYFAIGDNTPENREHLEKLGYTVYKNPDKKYIHPYTNQYQQAIAIGWGFEDVPKGAIDCRNNPPLFQAVTAMRDGSDYLQWFKTDFENKLIPDVKEMYLCKSREFCGITVKYKGEDFVIGSAGFHKASLSELQEHFKLK